MVNHEPTVYVRLKRSLTVRSFAGPREQECQTGVWSVLAERYCQTSGRPTRFRKRRCNGRKRGAARNEEVVASSSSEGVLMKPGPRERRSTKRVWEPWFDFKTVSEAHRHLTQGMRSCLEMNAMILSSSG